MANNPKFQLGNKIRVKATDSVRYITEVKDFSKENPKYPFKYACSKEQFDTINTIVYEEGEIELA